MYDRIRLNYGELLLFGFIKVGETCTLCSDISLSERHPNDKALQKRAYQLRYREAFFDGLSPFARLMVMLCIVQLKIVDSYHKVYDPNDVSTD